MTAWTKGILTSTAFVLVCLFVWFMWGTKISPQKLDTPVDSLNRLENEGAPDFELADFDGKKVRLYDYKGKIIVLNFWATWCAPCVTEFPSMVKMAELLKDKVVLVTVAADERKDDVLAFIKTFKGTAPNIVHLWDPTIKVAKAFGTERLPETYILKSDLKLAKKVVNSLDWSKPDVLEFLKRQ
jgi:cytochrome c biogenesis protein CcmG, thiol:disulfide interchange protein DsbE